MGWKAFREHYRIKHIVKVEDGLIHIGSGFVGSLVVVDAEGRIVDNATTMRSDLKRIVDEIEADPARAAALIASDDVFERSIAVYTWDRDEIVEELCEEPGWPNVTHAGSLMYENRYSTDREEVVGWARANAASAIESYEIAVAQAEEDLARARTMLDDARSVAKSIARTHPEPGEDHDGQ